MMLFNMLKFYNKKKVNLESIGKQKPLKSRSDKSQDFVWNNQTNNKSVCHAWTLHASKERLEI